MKKLVSTLLCASLFLMVGCSKEVEGPITVTDQTGREVTLEKPAEKVASGYYISTTILIGLDQSDKLTGVEMKADTRPIYKEAAPEVLELPALGNKKMFNVEECAKAEPDVVFLPASLESYVDELEALEIPVVLLEPETADGFEDAVEIIGEVMGCSDKVDAYFDYEEKLLEKYESETDNEEKTVYFAGSEKLSTATTGMYQNEILDYANAKNAIDIEGDNWVNIDVETLLAANPDYIFIEAGSVKVEDFTKDESLQELTAVKNENIYVFPSQLETWDTPSLSSCLGKLWASSIIAEDRISMETVTEETTEFYKTFYGFDVTSEMLGF